MPIRSPHALQTTGFRAHQFLTDRPAQRLPRPLHVLVISPQPALLEARLKRLGARVTVTWGAWRTLDHRVQQLAPDCMILDAEGRLGQALAVRLRRCASAPLVVCVDREEAIAALNVGSIASLSFLLRPFDDRDLRVTLDLAQLFETAHRTYNTLRAARCTALHGTGPGSTLSPGPGVGPAH